MRRMPLLIWKQRLKRSKESEREDEIKIETYSKNKPQHFFVLRLVFAIVGAQSPTAAVRQGPEQLVRPELLQQRRRLPLRHVVPFPHVVD